MFALQEQNNKSNPQNKNTSGYPDVTPVHRRPTQKDISNALPAGRKRNMLAQKTFEALSLLALSCPEMVIQ